VLPLFLFTPDGKKAMNLIPAVRAGLHNFFEMVREVRKHRNRMIFLLANMIYMNGLGALFAFGGIYAATTFGWGTIEMGLFGIFIVIASTIGALLGGPLDDKIGSKAVILGALAILIAMSVSIVMVDRDAIFLFPVEPKAADAGLFGSAGKALFAVRRGDWHGRRAVAGLLAHLARAPRAARSSRPVLRPVRAVR
jgi:MFS transporter, UMF1 family